MHPIIKKAVLAAVVAAAAITPLSAASARDDWRRHDRDDALAAGAIGLAAGAVLGALVTQPRGPVYIDPPYEPEPRYRAAPVYGGYVTEAPDYREGYYPAPPRARRVVDSGYSFEPWSRGWYNYCAQRYQSFNPRSGTYVAYDGQRRFCTAG